MVIVVELIESQVLTPLDFC